MGRKLFRVAFLFVSIALSAILPFPLQAAELSAKPELETLINQIENRHYRWIAFRSNIIFFFVAPGRTQQAMCGGDIIYQRLDERMLLTCYDSNKNLTFIFRTLDRRFDLYIPSQNTLYHGSIFDLEDSPEIESHLKLIDLYRALKPSMFDPSRTEIESASDVKISLNVFNDASKEKYLSRKVYVTPSGDVVGELFFAPDGQTLTEIQRYDFKELKFHVGTFKSMFFPKKVTIVSPLSGKNTAIFFSNVQPLDAVDTYQFLLKVPKGTQEVFLKEVDPRFSKMAVEAAQLKKPSEEENVEEPASDQPQEGEKTETSSPEPTLESEPASTTTREPAEAQPQAETAQSENDEDADIVVQ